MKLLLASESPRRKALLGKIVPDFQVEAQQVAEYSACDGIAVRDLPLANARLKAAAGAKKHPDMLVLGADTVVVLDDRTFGKPHSPAEATAFLRALSGREHEVLTGVSLQCPAQGILDEFTAVSKVRFRKLDENAIRRYLELVPVLDKAGAYGIQDHGEILVEGFAGELDNVIGLPTGELQTHLAALNFWEKR